MQYNFKVVNDNMVCDKREMPLTGNVNTYRCVFDIECDIPNLLWFCVFERDGKAYVQPILENECFIPHEVLVSEGKIKIGCYATNLKEDDFKRISTNWVFFNSLEGAYSDAAMPEVPEPDVWEELVLKSVPIIGENGNWFIYDITKMQYVDSGVKASGKDGYTPVKGVDYFTEEDKAEIEEDLKEKWDKLVDETLTENLATEFRQVFEKRYKRIRFKLVFTGASTTTLTHVRFKRWKMDGSSSPTLSNYLQYSNSGNLATKRYLSGTAYFDVDGRIVVADAATVNGFATLGTPSSSAGSSTFGTSVVYIADNQYFPEFYMYLGGSIAEDGTLSGNVLGAGTTIQVWGCEK